MLNFQLFLQTISGLSKKTKSSNYLWPESQLKPCDEGSQSFWTKSLLIFFFSKLSKLTISLFISLFISLSCKRFFLVLFQRNFFPQVDQRWYIHVYSYRVVGDAKTTRANPNTTPYFLLMLSCKQSPSFHAVIHIRPRDLLIAW